MEKSETAFSTIGEVADELGLPQHVLRYWETRFTQIRPIKKMRGRRYYRPEDVDLLRGIRFLLYSERFTIRGVQQILTNRGRAFVAACWQQSEPVGVTLAAEDRPGRKTAFGLASMVPGKSNSSAEDKGGDYLQSSGFRASPNDKAATLEPRNPPILHPAAAPAPSLQNPGNRTEPAMPDLMSGGADQADPPEPAILPGVKEAARAGQAPPPVMKEAARAGEAPLPVMKTAGPAGEAPSPIMKEAGPNLDAPSSVMKDAAPKVEAPSSVMKDAAPKVEAPSSVIKEAMPNLEAPSSVLKEAAPQVEAPSSVLKEAEPNGEIPMPEPESTHAEASEDKPAEQFAGEQEDAIAEVVVDDDVTLTEFHWPDPSEPSKDDQPEGDEVAASELSASDEPKLPTLPQSPALKPEPVFEEKASEELQGDTNNLTEQAKEEAVPSADKGEVSYAKAPLRQAPAGGKSLRAETSAPEPAKKEEASVEVEAAQDKASGKAQDEEASADADTSQLRAILGDLQSLRRNYDEIKADSERRRAGER